MSEIMESEKKSRVLIERGEETTKPDLKKH
jgi:hypothetical protein